MSSDRSMINIARYLKFVFRVAVHGVFPISIQFFVDTSPQWGLLRRRVATRPTPRSARNLFSDALSQFSELVRAEFQLARAEMGAKASLVGVAVGFLVGAVPRIRTGTPTILFGPPSLATRRTISACVLSRRPGGAQSPHARPHLFATDRFPSLRRQ
jgi:hypothetical protein